MARRGRFFVLPWLALALLLQAYAVMRSVAMNAPGNMDACPMHAAMGGGQAPAAMPMGAMRHHTPDKGRREACPYCAVAAHAPVFTQAPILRPSARIAYAIFFLRVRPGARGPTRILPRARGPPAAPRPTV